MFWACHENRRVTIPTASATLTLTTDNSNIGFGKPNYKLKPKKKLAITDKPDRSFSRFREVSPTWKSIQMI